jgi:hypothetical protein
MNTQTNSSNTETAPATADGAIQPTLAKADPLKHMARSIFRDVTPVRLRLLLIANCLCTFLFFWISISTLLQHQHVVQTVGTDATPSIIAAHNIKIAAVRMDADLSAELIYDASNEDSIAAGRDFEKQAAMVGKQLVLAAANITYGKVEQLPIENIQTALGEYLLQAQDARAMHRLQRSDEALTSYRNALKILQSRLLPNADALNKANADALEFVYAQEKSEAALARGLVLVLGILLVALLVYTQFFLKGRFRRRLNIALLISTFCTIALVQHLSSTLSHNSQSVKVAKEDAFNSVVALLETRADAYAASAAEIRGLLDHEKSDVHEKDYSDQIAKIAHFTNQANYPDTVETARKQLQAGDKINLPAFSGSMADELSNIRFEGEGVAATDALEHFGEYTAMHAKVRALEKSGAHQAAIKLCLDYGPEGSKHPFTKFDDDLNRTLNINQQNLESSIKDAFNFLDGRVLLTQIVSLIIVVCVYLGLSPRMAEYM